MGVAEPQDGMRLWGRMGDGRGNLRVAKTPPLQEALRSALRQMPPIAIVSMPYTMPHMETYGFYYDAACRVVVKTAGKRRGGRLRRGTPRRYVLRETGESVLNRRIPKGKFPCSILIYRLLQFLSGYSPYRGLLRA